jgi:hypothetical protein
LKYSRFYDWPPEPEYSHTYASAPPRSQHVGRATGEPGATSDDESDIFGVESDAHYYDAVTSKHGLKNVGHSLKMGTQAGLGATIQSTVAIHSMTGMRNVVDVATRTSTGAIQGTAKLLKKAIQGTRHS